MKKTKKTGKIIPPLLSPRCQAPLPPALAPPPPPPPTAPLLLGPPAAAPASVGLWPGGRGLMTVT